MFNEIRLKAAEMANKYPVGTSVVLVGVDGIPDNSRGAVEFVDDIGCIFIETGSGLKNVVLTPADDDVRFVKVCV